MREVAAGERAAQRRVLPARADRPLVRGACPRRSARRRRRHDAAGVPRSHARCTASRRCAPTSSPMRATSCARRSPRSRASSTRCKAPARDDAQARERFLAIMKTQATRMARLIDDLLSLSRIELIEHMHPDTPVDLVPIVRQVVDGLQTLATDRSVEIAIALPAAPADRARRPRRADPRVREPGRERAEIRRVRQARRHRLSRRPARRRRAGSAGDGARLRPRHRGRASAAPDRALLSRRRDAKPRRGRHRAWASRWSSTSSTATAAGSRSRARPGKGATFTVRLPLDPQRVALASR